MPLYIRLFQRVAFPKNPSGVGFSFRFSNHVGCYAGCGAEAKVFRVFGVQRVCRGATRRGIGGVPLGGSRRSTGRVVIRGAARRVSPGGSKYGVRRGVRGYDLGRDRRGCHGRHGVPPGGSRYGVIVEKQKLVSSRDLLCGWFLGSRVELCSHSTGATCSTGRVGTIRDAAQRKRTAGSSAEILRHCAALLGGGQGSGCRVHSRSLCRHRRVRSSSSSWWSAIMRGWPPLSFYQQRKRCVPCTGRAACSTGQAAIQGAARHVPPGG